MTNKEAYTWILDHFAPCDDGTKQDEALGVALEALEKQTWLEKSKLRDSLDMAIAALRNEQKSEESFSVSKGDVIYRQAAIDAIHYADGVHHWCALNAIERIKALPSAEPEIIRCGQCKYAEVADTEDSQDGYTCQFHRGSIWFSGSYCSWAERRTDD